MTSDVSVDVDGHVALVEMHRPPTNFFDEALLGAIGQALFEIDEDPEVRAIVLCAEGKHFCAGADLRNVDSHGLRRVYRKAFALFSTRKPIVAAVQGAAIGGGAGLALAADFRVATPKSRFSTNFARLGFHQGFGISVTLPAVVGQQKALELLYTGRAVLGTEALEIGLVDRLVDDDPRAAALDFAREIAGSAPMSLVAIRATMRRTLNAQVHAALDQEAAAQTVLLDTKDMREGIDASIGKREPVFVGA
jgi:enoyl-CoA hydratase/carnithine racemase